MVQETQATLNYKAELNEIQGIGYQQRRISDKMQVRDKVESEIMATGSKSTSGEGTEVTIGSRTTTVRGEVDYRVEAGKIYIPLGGTYLLQCIPDSGYTQTYQYTIKYYRNGKLLYSLKTTLDDRTTRTQVVKLGRKDEITATLTPHFSASATISNTIKLIKL